MAATKQNTGRLVQRHCRRGLAIACAWLLCQGAVLPVAAQTADTPMAAATLSGTQEWPMRNAKGETYRILISLPEGDVPYTGGYPVLYVLDANAYFASFHEAKRAQKAFRAAIIVGIAYPGDAPLNFLRRSYDFSPPTTPERNQPPQGGQDELLDFIEHGLMPAVAKAFPVDANKQSLFGHSFGGMFAVYTLFTRPTLFDHLVAASPSLWWQDDFLLPHEAAFRKRVQAGEVDVRHNSLALIVAGEESPQTVQDAQALHWRLRELSAQGLRSSYHLEPGEDHMSVPFRILSRVLRETLSARRR